MQELNRRTAAMKQPLGELNYSNEEYHASEGLSRSSLWLFKQLPKKFWYEKLSGQYQRPKETEAFLIGNLAHTMILEPELFDSQYFVMPKVNRTTKQGKADYAEALEQSQGKMLINEEQLIQVQSMKDSVYGNETAMQILTGAKIEKSLYWKHEATGLICKSRPDILNGAVAGDLKTTVDASYRAFQSDSYKSGYFLQAGMAFEACKSIGEPFEKFVFICVEKKAPFSVGLYILDDEALQFGIDMFHALMERIAVCFEKNVWPDFGVSRLSAPNYAKIDEGFEHE